MNEHLVSVLWFGAGVALQALLLIRGDWNWGRLALAINLFIVLPSILPVGNNSAKSAQQQKRLAAGRAE
jgi:hypothetical protein